MVFGKKWPPESMRIGTFLPEPALALSELLCLLDLDLQETTLPSHLQALAKRHPPVLASSDWQPEHQQPPSSQGQRILMFPQMQAIPIEEHKNWPVLRTEPPPT